MGGIPNPCAGCGDPTCSCCIANSADIEVLAGSGNVGECFQLGIIAGVVAANVCAEAVPSGALVSGDEVLVCGPALETKTYADACDQLNALAPAVGPAVPGDEVVIFDGVSCVRKTITPSDCPPSAAPVFAPCVHADLSPVWCDADELVTWPRQAATVEDEVEVGWIAPLAFLAEDTPTVMGTSALMTLTNDSCLYDMIVYLHGAGGALDYYGDLGGAWNVVVEESVNGGAFTGVHTVYGDYRGMTGNPAGYRDTHAIPSWNRTYTVLAGASMTYQWRLVITQTETPVNAAVENTSSRVIMLGVSEGP